MRSLQTTGRARNSTIRTGFLDLPPEMHAEIFNYIRPIERQKLRAICRTWDHIIGQLFQTQLRMTDPLGMFQTNAKFLSVTFNTSENHKLSRGSLLISFCSRIQKLTFNEIQLSSNFVVVLRHCNALKYLIIDHVKLNKTNMRLPNPELLKEWLPSLTDLLFVSSGNDESEKFMLSLLASILQTGSLEALHIMTKQHIDNLDFVNRNFVMGSDESTEISRPSSGLVYHAEINKIIAANQRTLRSIKIESLEFPSTDYKNICLDTYPRQAGSSKVYLKAYTAVDTLLLSNLEPTPWVKVLTRQTYLQELGLTTFDRGNLFTWLQDQTSTIILKNFATLTVIDLDFAVTVLGHSPTWDAETFSSCTALKQLELRQWPMRSYTFYLLAGCIPRIINTDKLPSSIQHFTTNFTISFPVATFNQIPLENFEKLKTLQLFGIPWFCLNGVHVPALTLKEYDYLATKLPRCHLFLMLNNYAKRNAAGKWKVYKTLSPGLMKKSRGSLKIDGEIFLRLSTSANQRKTNQAAKRK